MSAGKPPRLVTLIVAWTVMLMGAALMVLDIGGNVSTSWPKFGPTPLLGPPSMLGFFIIVVGVVIRTWPR